MSGFRNLEMSGSPCCDLGHVDGRPDEHEGMDRARVVARVIDRRLSQRDAALRRSREWTGVCS